VDKVSSMVNSFHDLWSLPVQISIAFLLLYLQVDIAFVAGVIIIIGRYISTYYKLQVLSNMKNFHPFLLFAVMIPTNNYIAKQIGTATERLMECKDIRVKFISECFRGIKSIKASGWESSVLVKSMAQRQDEMKYLSTRKYFDALCVFLWASMPLLVPFATFVTTVTVVKESLTVSQVFTTIALLNMLIFPMNAFPWYAG
jgi:ATP-binding cassette subfamily C (CFTR/MRP) protein 10